MKIIIIKRCRRVRRASTLSGSLLIGGGGTEVAQRAQTAAMESLYAVLSAGCFILFKKLMTAETEKLGPRHTISAIIISPLT